MIISIIVYLAFGFIFMTNCAKFGLIGKYDPPLFYWFCWPVVILTAVFRVISNGIATINSAVETYVNTLKPNQDEN